MNLKLFLVVALLVTFIAACNDNAANNANDSTSAAEKADTMKRLSPDQAMRLAIFENVFEKFDGPGGPVLLSKAEPCFRLYETRMAEHGVGRPVPVNVRITKEQKITDYVIFGGKELLNWIEKTVKKYDPDGLGDNLEFHIQFGIYTDTYIGERFPAGQERERRKNRFTVFIVPYDLRTKKNIAFDDTEVFNLGGLQP